MLLNKPTLSYNGLTIILSNPSRLDKASLLTGVVSHMVNEALGPQYNLYQCEVRLKSDTSQLRPNTRVVILCGEDCKTLIKEDRTLNEIRGSVYRLDSGPYAIPTYYPQDCIDIKNYEAEFNKQYEEFEADESETGSVDEKARHGRTKRKNFGFWFKKDVEKAKKILKLGEIPNRPFEPEYVIYPNAETIIHLLTTTKDELLFIDIETDCELNILCISFSFGYNSPILVFPLLDYNYQLGYGNLHQILRAIAIAFRDNIVVAHNGAGFDYLVFAHKYRIGIGQRTQDTMLMHHRCYPEVEKSLGHCTALWTFEPFHKDEGGGGYNTFQQARQLWAYCAKDVYTMKLIHHAIMEHGKRNIGLMDSFKQVNSSIRPYLITTLQGIAYDADELEATMKENDRLMYQYLRMLGVLIGKENLKKIKGTGKSSLPSSNVQCCSYFHTMLGYPVVGRGKETKNGTRNPSLAKRNMFRLKLKFDNPCIDLIIAYRELQKESGSLKFQPWIY